MPNPATPAAHDDEAIAPDPEAVKRAKKRTRRRRNTWISLAVVTVLAITGVVLQRTHVVANEAVRLLQAQVLQRTGLSLTFDRVGFSWSHLTVYAEGVEVRHPTEGRLARVEVAELRPAFSSLFWHNPVKISSINVDGGSVELRFRHGQLVNGPRAQPQQGHQQPELPVHDVAISDVHVRIDHDELGVIDLPSVDVDVHRASADRVLVGVLAQGGSVSGARCFSGPVDHVEARVELRHWNQLTVALARVEVAGVSVRVREAHLPLDLHGPIQADAEVSGSLPALTCPLPRGNADPRPHGNVTVSVRGTFDPATTHFNAEGRVQGQHLSLEMPWSDSTGRFGLGSDADVHFIANQDVVTVTAMTAHHSGGTLVSPGTQPEHPLRIHIGDLRHPTLEGHLDLANVELHKLVHELSVTDFAKVLWTVSAHVDVHGDLWRFGEPPDARHPALVFDLDAETQHFAVLSDFYMRQPQHAVISIPRGSITGQIAVDGQHVRFRHLVGLFGVDDRSRIELDLIALRLSHDPREPDILIEGGRANNVYLDDLGHIADFAIGGMATFTVQGSGPFSDPIIVGEAHLRNFHYNDFPLGDFDTRAGSPWHFRQLRVDMPVLDGRAGRSVFVARNAYLDFHRYTVSAGAHIVSDAFVLRDYYHMFKFENDPTFEQFSGQTMPRCPRPGSSSAHTDVPCVDPSDPYEQDPERPHVPAGTEGGHVETEVSFVLGRPGDDPGGVMDVEIWARNLYILGFGEAMDHVDAHYHYDWLVRDHGFRGARQDVEYVRGRLANGFVRASGHVDLGGEMHFVGTVREVALAQLQTLANQRVTGTLNGSGTLEGQPDAQRWAVTADVRSLSAAQRNFGDVSVQIGAQAEGPRSNDPTARPPRNVWTLDASALGGGVRVHGGVAVPWHGIVWHDVDGHAHSDWDRDWPHGVLHGQIALTRPLDLVPFVPARWMARLGTGAHAQVRAQVDLENAQLGDVLHADARLTVDTLDVGAQGMALTLAPGAHFAACVHDGTYWVDPAAEISFAPCLHTPAHLTRRAHVTAAMRAADPVAPAAHFLGPEGTEFSLSGGGTVSGRLDAMLTGQFDLARLAALVPGVTSARGIGHFEVNVAGDAQRPELSGTFRLAGGALAAAILPSPVEDIQLLVRLDGNDIVFDQALAQFGASSITMTGGRVHIQGRDIDRVDIPVRVQNLSLVPEPGVEISMDANTRLTWTPSEALPVFSGDVNLARVRYTRPINLSQDSTGETHVAGADAGETQYDPRNDHVALNLTVHSREPMRVTNNVVDGEVVIADNERPFQVLGTDQRIGVIGTLLIPRGRMVLPVFRGSDFEISRGRIEFDNRERIAPNFDLTARTEVHRGTDVSRNQWRVNLHAYGTPDRFALDLTSEPSLSFTDLFSLLTIGATRAELDQAGAGNLGQAIAVQAIAAVTGIDRTVRQALPVIDDFRIGSAYSPLQGRTVPQVAIGRRINDSVRVGATVNTTDQRETRATVDVRVNDHTSVQVGYDNYNDDGSSQFGNLGLDLRWRVEFE